MSAQVGGFDVADLMTPVQEQVIIEKPKWMSAKKGDKLTVEEDFQASLQKYFEQMED